MSRKFVSAISKKLQNKMAIEIVLTKRIQNIIVGALKSEQVHKELAERLSPFMHEPSGKKESKEYRKKASIPFSIVKQLWECLRDETAGNRHF